MAIGDISAFAPIAVTLGTAAAVVATVPNSEEWTLRLARAVCLVTGTAPTVSVGITSAANELCFNEVVTVPSSSTAGAKNIVGPDFVVLPPGATIYARASAATAIRLLLTGTKKQVA